MLFCSVSLHVCVSSRQGQVDGQAWREEDGGGGWRGNAASLLILYLSSLSTGSSAVAPSSPKPKYYYLCPLSIITPPLSIISLTPQPSSDHHYLSAAQTNHHSSYHELRPEPGFHDKHDPSTKHLWTICLTVSIFTPSKAVSPLKEHYISSDNLDVFFPDFPIIPFWTFKYQMWRCEVQEGMKGERKQTPNLIRLSKLLIYNPSCTENKCANNHCIYRGFKLR